MTNLKSKPSGYGVNDELTSVEMNIVDTGLENSLDGAGGGPYTPTATIEILGAFGMTITTLVVPLAGIADFCSGSVTIDSVGGLVTGGGTPALFQGDVTVASPRQLTTNGVARTNGLLDVRGGADVRGGLNVIDGAIFNGTSSFVGAASFTTSSHSGASTFAGGITGAVTFSGSVVTFSSSVDLNNTMVATATVQIDSGSKLQYAGTGHEVRRYVTVSDADHTGGSAYSIADGDLFYMNTLGSVNRSVQFLNTGATAGCVIEFFLNPSAGAHNCVIQRHDGGTLVTLIGQAITGNAYYVKLVHDGSNWFGAFVGKN